MMTKIDYEWLTRATGDPFADVGGYVIKYLSEKYPEKDVLGIIEFVAKIYVNKWNSKIGSFFLNSAITQPNFKGSVKIDETLKYFSSLIYESGSNDEGCCRITGRKGKVFKAGRDNSILSGSGAFVNFHHNFQPGMMLSKEMIIRQYFIPFGTIYVGGRIAVVQSNLTEINEFFVKINCEANLNNLAASLSDGVLKSEFSFPANALFQFVDNLFINEIVLATDQKSNLSISLLLFTNYATTPEISLYNLPANIFRFYSTCQLPKLKADWLPFLFAHYTNSRFKDAKYNVSTNNYEVLKKNETEQIAVDDYKQWKNIILDNLLQGKSILRHFVRWGAKRQLNYTIVELYQKNVQGMKQETLNKIKELALFLTNADADAINKSIKALDGYKSAYELRRFFLKNIVVKNYKDEAKEPMITVDELVYYLFPDDISWKDVRDILLFAIYQELHAKNIKIEADLSDDDTEIAEN